jgi:cyanophycin synthetase
MKIISTNVFVGPNVWASFPVIRHVVDLGPLEEWPSARIGQDYVDALVVALPGLKEHGCSYREPGGFVRRLREDDGTWLGHVMEHCALEIQGVAGTDVSFGRTRSTGEPGHYYMVYTIWSTPMANVRSDWKLGSSLCDCLCTCCRGLYGD